MPVLVSQTSYHGPTPIAKTRLPVLCLCTDPSQSGLISIFHGWSGLTSTCLVFSIGLISPCRSEQALQLTLPAERPTGTTDGFAAPVELELWADLG